MYCCSFKSGYGSVSWLVFAEILPPKIRPKVYPLGIAIMWFMNFILTTLYEPMLSQIGTHGLLWTYAGISAFGFIFIAVCLPETKEKMPFEIAAFYEKRPKITSWRERLHKSKIDMKQQGSQDEKKPSWMENSKWKMENPKTA